MSDRWKNLFVELGMVDLPVEKTNLPIDGSDGWDNLISRMGTVQDQQGAHCSISFIDLLLLLFYGPNTKYDRVGKYPAGMWFDGRAQLQNRLFRFYVSSCTEQPWFYVGSPMRTPVEVVDSVMHSEYLTVGSINDGPWRVGAQPPYRRIDDPMQYEEYQEIILNPESTADMYFQLTDSGVRRAANSWNRIGPKGRDWIKAWCEEACRNRSDKADAVPKGLPPEAPPNVMKGVG